MILGLDPSPRRIGLAVLRPDGHRSCLTVPLVGEWKGREPELAHDRIRAMLALVAEQGEPTDVAWEDGIAVGYGGAKLLGAVLARLEDAVRGVWPHAVQRQYLPHEWRALVGIGTGLPRRGPRRGVLKERAWALSVSRGWEPRTEDDADAACVAMARAVELGEVWE